MNQRCKSERILAIVVLAKNREVEEQKNWTPKSIFERLNSAIVGNDISLAIMAQYCLRSGGGARSFDNLGTRLVRKLRMKGSLRGALVGGN
jgi:hypothetical protein